MSTTNVKILLRRGLRKDISHDTLETGELGFAIDTNQLYVGIDEAINEIQFDPFANAQNIIQSWLNSTDCPYLGLTVDEDLIVRLDETQDIGILLSAMHYFEQTVTFGSEIVNFGTVTVPTNGKDTLVLPSTLINVRPTKVTYTIDGSTTEVPSTDFSWDASTRTITLNSAIPNSSVNNKTATVTIVIHRVFTPYTPAQGNQSAQPGETLYQYKKLDEKETFTATNSAPADETESFTTSTAGEITFTLLRPLSASTFSVLKVEIDGTETTDFTVDEQVVTLTGTNPITGGETVDITLTHQPNIQTKFTMSKPFSSPGISKVEIDGTETTGYTVDGQDVTINASLLSGGETVDITATEQVIWASGEIISYNVDPITEQTVVKVKVPEPSQNPFANQSYAGFHVENQGQTTDEHEYYFSTLATGSIEPMMAVSTTGVSTFDIGLYGRARTNVEVVTENTYNQMFADQKLNSLDSTTGLRPSLFKKNLTKKTAGPDKLEIGCRYRITNIGTNANAQDNWNTVAGTNDPLTGAPTITYAIGDVFTAVTTVTAETDQGSAETFDGCFMSWDAHDCTSFFIDYSLVQKKNPNKFVRVGTIKVINGVPQGINKIKLTDDNTEIWQDLNTDGIADIDEFSNIEFSSKIEGNNIKFMYKQDFDWETEISYTIKRWKM